MELSVVDLYNIDPYKAVDVMGKWFLSFNSERSLVEARRMVNELLNKFPKEKRGLILDSLMKYEVQNKNKAGKTAKKAV